MKVNESVKCAFHEVDAHNIVPVWEASSYEEYAARTIRPKIQKKLDEFFTDFPEMTKCNPWSHSYKPTKIDWISIIKDIVKNDADENKYEIKWVYPGKL